MKHNRNKPAKKITATTGENKQLKGDTLVNGKDKCSVSPKSCKVKEALAGK